MPNDYTKLRLDFFEEFGGVETDIKTTEQAGAKFPLPVLAELHHAVICFVNAEEEFSKGNEREAAKEMQRAINHVCRASADVREYRFLFYLGKYRAVKAHYIEGNEDLVYIYVRNYRKVHSKRLFGIEDVTESKKLPSKDSSGYKAIYEGKIRKIRAFLFDFEVSKSALVVAIKKEKQTVQFQETHIRLSYMTIAVAAASFVVALLPHAVRFLEFLWELITTQTP